MSRKMQINGFEVRIDVPVRARSFGYSARDADDARRDADEIVKEIKRHVAPYCEDARHAHIVMDSEAVCDSCGARWTEKDDHYNGGCCEKDQTDQDAREAAPAGAA